MTLDADDESEVHDAAHAAEPAVPPLPDGPEVALRELFFLLFGAAALSAALFALLRALLVLLRVVYHAVQLVQQPHRPALGLVLAAGGALTVRGGRYFPAGVLRRPVLRLYGVLRGRLAGGRRLFRALRQPAGLRRAGVRQRRIRALRRLLPGAVDAEYPVELVKFVLHPGISQVTCLPRRAYYGADGVYRRRSPSGTKRTRPRPRAGRAGTKISCAEKG